MGQKNRQSNYLVKQTLNLSILIFTLTLHSSLIAQVIDITQLDQLEEFQKLQQQQNENSDMPMSIEDKAERERSMQRKNKELLEDKVTNYGYTGRRDFMLSPQTKTLDKSLQYFGYDYFIDAPTTYAPVTDIPIPQDYILGPGDEIKIVLFGNKNKQYTLQVTRDGDIFFPEIGPLSVAGLTFLDLKEAIKQAVENQMIGTKASLTLGTLRSINIFVLGEASQPGMYTVSSLSTLTNAIFTSGGIKTTGSLRNIEVKRNGQVLSNFDFYHLLLNGDTSDDVKLVSGDVVFIPPITKTVGIAGEIERPGIYELKEDETAEDLISFAGTLKPKADLSSVEILRIDPKKNGFNLINVDLNQSSVADLYLSNGDVLTIYPVVNKMGASVLISGHAQKPGFYPWSEGMKLLDILKSPKNLLPMTDMNYVLIKRENKNLSYQTLQIDLEELFAMSDSDQNIVLKERDEIIFFPALLALDLINVELVREGYDNIDKKQALVYARKSFREEAFNINTNEAFLTTEKFFQYTIHGYCTLSEDYARKLLAPATLVQATTDKIGDTSLTGFCRRQLLDPVIAFIDKQGTAAESRRVVEIYGNVTYPGRYPLSLGGATLEEMLKASGGLKEGTFIDEIEITKRASIGKEVIGSTETISLQSDTRPILIDPLDIITIKKLSGGTRTAKISGEVFFPGIYPISPNETITVLLKRVGGIKDTASLKSSVFQRESLKKIELKRFRQLQSEARRNILLAQKSQGIGEESTLEASALSIIFQQDMDAAELIGRLVINLESIMEGTADDIILEDKDELMIPKTRQTVSVMGEVYIPNSHMYDSNYSIESYITMSGGPTEFADINSRYIIKADGSIRTLNQSSNSRFFRPSNVMLESGDTIVIPLKVDQYSGLKATTEITQIIYQMALAAAAVNSF